MGKRKGKDLIAKTIREPGTVGGAIAGEVGSIVAGGKVAMTNPAVGGTMAAVPGWGAALGASVGKPLQEFVFKTSDVMSKAANEITNGKLGSQKGARLGARLRALSTKFANKYHSGAFYSKSPNFKFFKDKRTTPQKIKDNWNSANQFVKQKTEGFADKVGSIFGNKKVPATTLEPAPVSPVVSY